MFLSLSRCPHHLLPAHDKFYQGMGGSQVDQEKIAEEVQLAAHKSLAAQQGSGAGADIGHILQNEEYPVEGTGIPQQGITEPGTDEEEKAEIAQNLMGPELPGEEGISPRIQKMTHIEQGPEGPQRHPDPHPVFVSGLLEGGLPEKRGRLIHHPAPLGHHLQGEDEIGQLVGIHGPVKFLAHRVNAAVHADYRADAGFGGAQEVFVFHVGGAALPDRTSSGIGIDHLPRDITHPRIGEIGRQTAQRIGSPDGIGVGKSQYFPFGEGNGLVEGRRLAGAVLLPKQAQVPVGEVFYDFIGSVRGAVGDDNDFQAIRGIFQGQLVVDGCRNMPFLIESSDKNGNERLCRLFLECSVDEEAQNMDKDGIARIDIKNHPQRQEKKEGQHKRDDTSV